MKLRLLFAASLVVLAACQDSDITSPPRVLPAGALPAISDGANAGNPDFWFLSPMVSNPNGNPLYNDNGFNAGLQATVEAVDLSNSAVVLPATAATVNGNHYQLNWKIPKGANKTYRVTVSVGSVDLGFADVSTSKTSMPGFVKANDGSTLPVKFVIENFALCEVPGTGPCSSETINLQTTSEVNLVLPGYGNSGVTIPPQDEGGTTTITLEPCDLENPGFEDMNPAVTDLPTYGPCMVIEANPPLSEVDDDGTLDNPAIVFVCDISPDLGALTIAQRKLVTLHKWDAPNSLKALPHAPHACEETVGFAGMKGFFANIRRGSLAAAGKQLASLFTPRMLYAATMLDVGAGGSTQDFSAFQFALPSKIEIVTGDNQTAAPGSTLPIDPTVLVTDLQGGAVSGATVRFVTSLAACGDTSVSGVSTNATGHASTIWTISATAGPNVLHACGRGLAGDEVNGPRGFDGETDNVVDPFQPLSVNFGDASEGETVVVGIGSVEFNATGVFPETTIFDFGSGPYSFLDIGVGADAADDYGIATTAVPPTGWETTAFIVPGTWTTTASAPFGAGCSTTAASPFPENHDLVVRRSFTTTFAGTVEVTVRIDNDAQIWLDGVNVTASGVGASSLQANGAGADDDWWIHDGCADADNIVFKKLSVPAGSHTLAIWAHDRGSVGLLDVKVVLKP